MKTVLALILSLPLATHAAVVFTDGFEGQAQGADTAPATWFIEGGSVDIVGFGCHSGSNCVNLDGFTNQAGAKQNGIGQLFMATVGVTYNLSFWLGGSQKGDANTVDIALGDATLIISSIPSDAPSTLHNVSWLATHGGFEAVTFLNSGDDSKGAILDDVRLETAETQTAPEPETSLLLGVSMVGLGWLFRRRRLADADHAARVVGFIKRKLQQGETQ